MENSSSLAPTSLTVELGLGVSAMLGDCYPRASVSVQVITCVELESQEEEHLEINI